MKQKIILTLLYVLTILSLAIMSYNHATGYELSIYNPIQTVWVLLILSSLGGINLVVYFWFSDKLTKNILIITLFLILINNFIILSMKNLRGYVFYGNADALTHMGYVRDIVSNGYISLDNIYPVTHILIGYISLVSNISTLEIANYIVPLLSILYILFIYILSIRIFNNRILAIPIILSSTVFIFSFFHTDLKPQFISLMTIPLILYFLYSTKEIHLKIPLILLIILTPFFHPFTNLFFIISIFLVITLSYSLKIRYNESCRIVWHLLFISIVTFVFWVSSFNRVWGSSIVKLGSWLKGDVVAPITSGVPTIFEKLNLSSVEIIELLTKLFGHIIIFVGVSSIYIIGPLRKDRKYFILSIFFLSGILLQLTIMSGGIGLKVHRALSYATILSPIFVGSFFYHVKNIYSGKTIGCVVIMLIVSLSWLIGALSIYPSPFIMLPNDQVTKADVYGAEWFYKYKNDMTRFIYLNVGIRFAHLTIGVDNTTKRSDISPYTTEKRNIIPDHFNYLRNEWLGQSFKRDMYMTISEYDKQLYTIGPWRPVGRFTYDDFDKLNYDQTVNHIYDNRGNNIYYIYHL